MKDQDGNEMSEGQILEAALDVVSDASCLLFETTSPEGIAAAWMADSLLKYIHVISKGGDVLLAAGDYQKFESEVNPNETP